MERITVISILIIICILSIMYMFDNSIDPLTTVNQSERVKLLSECLHNETLCKLVLGPSAQINCIYDCARTKINSSYKSRNRMLVVGSTTNTFIYENETNL